MRGHPEVLVSDIQCLIALYGEPSVGRMVFRAFNGLFQLDVRQGNRVGGADIQHTIGTGR